MLTLSSVNPIALSSLLAKSKETSFSIPSTSESLFVHAGIFEAKKGSAYVELSSAKVICIVYGPVEPEKSGGIDEEEGKIKVEVKGAPELNQIVESALCSFVRLDRFPKAQVNVEITVLEDDAAKLAAVLVASSVALCNAEIETYDLCLASHFWVSIEGKLFGKRDELEKCSSLTVAVMPSLNQMVCCEYQGILSPSILLKTIPLAVKETLLSYATVRKAVEAFSIPEREKNNKV